MTAAVIAVIIALIGVIKLPGRPVLGLLMLLVAGSALAAILASLAEAKRAIPDPLVGAELTALRHPRLWRAIDTAAGRLGVQPPVRIVVDGAARAARSRRPGGSELVIGLPLLIGLSQAQLLAVLTRELAQDAEPGAAVHLLQGRLELLQRRLEYSHRWWQRPAQVLIVGYSWAYRRLAAAANQRHEQRAHDRAAALHGSAAMASALARAELVQQRWQTLVSDYLPLSAIARRRAPLSDGLRSLLAVPPSRSGSGNGSRAATPVRPGPADDEAAAVLLGEGEADIATLERAVLPDDDPPADWSTIAEIASQTEVLERSAELAWAIQASDGDNPVTLASVLALIANGAGLQIVDPLLPADLPPNQRSAAAQHLLEQSLTAMVVSGLLRRGRALHEVSWPDGIRLLRRSGNAWIRWDGDELIRSGTADPAGTAALYRWLREIDADLDSVTPPARH